MSYFFTSKSHLLSHQTENIILAEKLHLTLLIFTKHKNMYSQQDNMQTLMSNIQNKNTLYVNFNKHKREYMIIPIIPIGGIHLHLYQNNLTHHSTGKNIQEKFFN